MADQNREKEIIREKSKKKNGSAEKEKNTQEENGKINLKPEQEKKRKLNRAEEKDKQEVSKKENQRAELLEEKETETVKHSFTYIVRCSDDTFYTGWTTHLEERIRVHNEGKGAKYTRSRRPVELVYWETFETKQEAMSREAAIKRLSRREKEELIENRGDRKS